MKKIGVLLLLGCFCASIAQTASKRDRKFAQKAAEDGLMEIKLGLLTQENSVTREVSMAGTETASDDVKANEELNQLAHKKNIVLPLALSDKKQEQYDKFSFLREKKFDKKYVKYMLEDLKKDIRMYSKEAKMGNDEELRSWAAARLEILKERRESWKKASEAVRR